MNQNLDVTLYLVTDSQGQTEAHFLATVEQACRGGVTLIQLREKEAGGKEFLEKALQVKKIADRYQIPLMINDRADVALACGAAGVHVGSSDLPVAAARKILGPEKIVGATAKTLEAAKKAWLDGADYLGVGAIYHSSTKEAAVATPVSLLKEICQAVPIPVAAIGGLNGDNIGILKGTGISGIAVVSAIMGAADPEKAASDLKKQVKELCIKKEPEL